MLVVDSSMTMQVRLASVGEGEGVLARTYRSSE